MKPILLLLFAATAACVGALLPLISRARSKRLLLNAVRRASSDAPDGIGISVLCSGVTDAAQIENLLSPEYSRYEVIVVLDARRRARDPRAGMGRQGVRRAARGRNGLFGPGRPHGMETPFRTLLRH